MFNKLKFKAKIIEAGFTIYSLSNEVGMNPATMHRKMNGDSDFTRKEIQDLGKILNLSLDNIKEIFFAD